MLNENIRVTFTKRTVPIPVVYRPLYRTSQILLVLLICSRGAKASLLKLHLFLWGLKSEVNQTKFKALISSSNSSTIWSIDPTVVRAINFAMYEGLVTNNGGGIRLTSKGEIFVKKILSEDIFYNEVTFLRTIGITITEQKVNQLSKNWTSQNA